MLAIASVQLGLLQQSPCSRHRVLVGLTCQWRMRVAGKRSSSFAPGQALQDTHAIIGLIKLGMQRKGPCSWRLGLVIIVSSLERFVKAEPS
jgi:hypothetical protein